MNVYFVDNVAINYVIEYDVGMDPRTKPGPDGVPAHCQYSRCQEGSDGGPAPLAQTPGKRARYYCCDAHRALAHQEGARRGRVAVLPTPAARQVVYGDDVVAVHRDFRTSLADLKALAEQLAHALVPAADVRAAQTIADQAEAALAARERQNLAELGAEIEARIAAVDRAEAAEETAALAREGAEQARAAQLEAEALLVAARGEFERDRAAMREELERVRRESEEVVIAANARAAAAEADREQTAADARAEIERIRSAADAATRDARELAARAEGTRDAAIAEAKLAHDDARRAREENERVRAQFEQQVAQERERADVRVGEVRTQLEQQAAQERAHAEARLVETRESAATRIGALERELAAAHQREQQARTDAQIAAKELARQRESRELELADEKARAEVRVDEVRAGLVAQLALIQKLADDRALERDRLAEELKAARSGGAQKRGQPK